ncbi:proline-specific peptidase [Imleria badia]|nr:proline-specific peptidase [Imleria badia]
MRIWQRKCLRDSGEVEGDKLTAYMKLWVAWLQLVLEPPPTTAMSETTGKTNFRVGGETYQTWYRIFGDLKSGVRPLVVLHGGPGLSHHYVLPFEELHTRFNIPVIFYDQIGIGESSHPKKRPQRVLDVRPLHGHAVHYVRLPAELRETIEKHEREGTTEYQEYQEGMKVFYAKHVCKLTDPTVYSTMLGPSEFTIVGTLKDWSCLDQIHTIDCPTFLTNGADDEAQDVAVEPFFRKIPKARWVTFAKSSRMACFEGPDRYFNIVGKFLTEA